ncbi:MAG TPA: phenylacetate--CoA ligase family protein [Candidatus Binatia bacterium]|nr:phenylacetate--CoA ligase family protein [Candidatus Binatia bacterium]
MSESVLIEHVYPRLPVFLQNAACWYYGQKEARVRSGVEFERYLQDLLETEKWSASEIEAYQNEKLCGLVRHAYENVPYYRERWKSLKLTPADIKSREDLPKLPILTKEDVRQNLDRLISETANRHALVFRHTSGTTGKALHFYTTKAAIAFQWAVWWRHRARFGVQPGAWHANFTGKRVVPLDQRTPPFWRWNRPMHQALLTMHHLSAERIPHIIQFLNSHQFDFYSGYPSIIHMLALHARAAGFRLNSPPRAVFTGAENMLDFQRRDIQEFTGAVLTDQYGCSEGCGNASQCQEFVYHEDSEFGVLEPVELQAGNPARSIVCTGLACDAFPFIRYEVGDAGEPSEKGEACRCGRKSRVWIRIEGRKDDYVITPEGLHIMRFDYVFKDAMNVEEVQVVQERLGEVVLRIVRRPGFKVDDESEIACEVGRWISPTLRVRFEYVSEIERETNGKFRAVLSRLSRDLKTEHSFQSC